MAQDVQLWGGCGADNRCNLGVGVVFIQTKYNYRGYIMNKINKIVLWLLAILFFIIGFAAVFSDTLIGLLFLLGSVLCIPSTKYKISNVIGYPYETKHNAILIFILITSGLLLAAGSQDRKAQELGFTDAKEQKTAENKGAKTKSEYDKILAAEAKKLEEQHSLKTRELAAAKAAVEEKKRLAKIESDKACRADLLCWAEKHFATASVYCPPEIERFAKYDFKWTDGLLEVKLSRYAWKNKNKGIISYVGDKIKLQNGFGAFSNHIYICDVDTLNNQIINIKMAPGRL